MPTFMCYLEALGVWAAAVGIILGVIAAIVGLTFAVVWAARKLFFSQYPMFDVLDWVMTRGLIIVVILLLLFGIHMTAIELCS